MQNSVVQRIRRGELTIGSWMTLGHPALAEIMAGAGFDWLTVDLEHSALDLAQAQHLVQVIELAGCTPFVRVGANDPTLIKRVMDTGAHGVIVPMVNSKDEAQRAVQAMRYPPVGTRGVGLARAQRYGTAFEAYRDGRERETALIVQIEHIEAVRHLEEILSVKGVDAFFVGPYDLSGSVGQPGAFEHPEVRKALARIRRVGREMGVPAGIHVIQPDAEDVARRVAEGFRVIALSLETLFLARMASTQLERARALTAAGYPLKRSKQVRTASCQ